MILLDTNIVSYLMGQVETVDAWFHRYPPSDIYTSAITRAEVQFGIARLPEGRRRSDLELRAAGVLAPLSRRTIPFDTAAADAYGPILASRQSAGRPMTHEDAQIAAIAVSRHAVLATRNVRDFEGCGVVIVNPFDDA